MSFSGFPCSSIGTVSDGVCLKTWLAKWLRSFSVFFPWQCKASPETLILVISTVAQQEAELVRDLSSSLTTAAPRGPHFFSSFSEIPVQKNSVMSPADQFVNVARASMRMQKVKQKLDSVMVSQI